MKRIVFILTVITGLIFNSCEVTDFDLQDNPNELTPGAVSPDFLLNEIQILFVESMNDLSITTDDIMRYEAMMDSYTDIAEPSTLNGEWDDVYALRTNLKILEELAEENETLLFHRGMAKILNAYAMATLVDYLGDIPYTEANDPTNFNPKADDDAAIYQALLDEIDLAINDLSNATFTPELDIYFDGDAAKWIKLANSLKVKMLLNMGDTSGINALIAEGNLITSEEDDFYFQYSTAEVPDSRHPYFVRAYLADGPGEYMGNYFMWLLKDSKSIQDPRLRYYVYRQTNQNPQDVTSGDFLRCDGDPSFDYCYIGDYYWGRDHGDDSSTPNDRSLKTVYGLYPAGGTFDADNAVSVSGTTHIGGAGIFPVLLSSYMKFLQAEAVLSLGASGDAQALLEEGIRESMQKVANFSTVGVDSNYAASQTDIEDYVEEVLSEYSAAIGNEQKLDLVIREYYIAAYGNSIEAYNAYRRTGYPSNIQIPIKNETIAFPRTISLPKKAVDTNTNLQQRPVTNQVFWDTNPTGFIK